MDIIHENLAYSYSYSWNFQAWIYSQILFMKKIQYSYSYLWNLWIYCIYRYYLQRESFNIRSFLIVSLLKNHLCKSRKSDLHMNLIIMCLILISRQWNSVCCNKAVLIDFIYKILFRSKILLFLRHMTDSWIYSWILHCICIHICEILRLWIYSWILFMKKSHIHIHKIHEEL